MLVLRNVNKVARCSMNTILNSSSTRKVSSQREVDPYEEEFLKNYVEINDFQKALLTVGSAVGCILNPWRADLIACFGETAGESAIIDMYHKMEDSEEGARILRERPRINSKTVDLDKLKKMPPETLGRTYSDFLEINNVTPDSRLPVQFIDDINLAFVLQRYREGHDLFHTILGMPTNMLGEITVKWVEALQFKLPMCIGAAIFGPIRLKPKNRQLYKTYCLPWAIETGRNSNFLLNVYFEERWEQPISELQEELNIKPLILPKITKHSRV